MKVLISFCNTYGNINMPNLLILDISTKDSIHIPTNVINGGFVGVNQDRNFIYTLYQPYGSTSKAGIVIIKKQTMDICLIKELPELREPHSLVVVNDNLYAASSGTDQILEYHISSRRDDVSMTGIFWFPDSSLQRSDTHHLNSLFIHNGDMYVSAFGPKTNTLWSSAKCGYIYNISKNELLYDGIYHPHSIFVSGDSIYYCESSRMSVKRNDTYLFSLNSGYTRGLCIWGKYLLLGTSSGRKYSRSIGVLNNPDDPGELIVDCRLIVYEKCQSTEYKPIDSFNFAPKHMEIYDVMILD